MSSTYDIKSEFLALQELMENDELLIDSNTGEVIEDNTELLQSLLNDLESDKEEKADSIIYIAKEYKAKEDMLSAEIKRLQERKSMMVRNQDRLKNLLDYLLAGEKLKTSKFTIFYAKSEALEIIDESLVPSSYIAFTPKIDKTSLKKSVKNGEVEIDGISLKETIGIRWR